MKAPMLNGKRLCALDRAALLAGVAILGYLLFLPPVVGLANNGDFEPGRYMLDAERNGFLPAGIWARGPNSAGSNLTLDGGTGN